MNIALIGGGASAACVVEHLAYELQHFSEPVQITIFDASPHLWVGRAYRPDIDEVIVNAPLTIMSLHSWDREHAINWYEHLMGSCWDRSLTTQDSFPPRALFGAYIEETVSSTMRRLTMQGWSFRHIPEMVIRANRNPDGFSLETPSRRLESFEYVVLCVGGEQRADPYKLNGAFNYLPDPYPLSDRLVSIAADAHIGIIGAGLTAVDIVQGLRARKHQGKITLLSRHGLLPSIRRPVISQPARYVTRSAIEALIERDDHLTLKGLFSLFCQELRALGASNQQLYEALRPTQIGIERLRTQLQQLQKPANDWQQSLQMAFAQFGQKMWFFLSIDEKRDFLQNYHTAFMSWMGPMPKFNAAWIIELADKEQLDMMSGVREVIPTTQGRFRAITPKQELAVDVLINAIASQGYEIPNTAKTLIHSFIVDDVASLHPLGGLNIEPDTCRVVNRQGQAKHGLFVLEDITRGTVYLTSSMIAVAQQAQNVAKAISHDALSQRLDEDLCRVA